MLEHFQVSGPVKYPWFESMNSTLSFVLHHNWGDVPIGPLMWFKMLNNSFICMMFHRIISKSAIYRGSRACLIKLSSSCMIFRISIALIIDILFSNKYRFVFLLFCFSKALGRLQSRQHDMVCYYETWFLRKFNVLYFIDILIFHTKYV